MEKPFVGCSGRPSEQDSAAAISRLDTITPIIAAIRDLFQAQSFSIGVVYHGQTIYTKGFGYADKKSGRVPDKDTIYAIASCTKGFTGTAISLLADQGKLNLDERVAQYITSFYTENSPFVSQRMTVKDLLSHCSGLSPLQYEVIGKNGSVFARREDVIQICNNLPREAEFRSEWKYNNWMFALAGVLIQQVSQQTFGQFVQQEVFKPLGMTRTACENPQADDNYARPCLTFSDSTTQLMDLPSLSDGWAFDASGSVRSCVSDMLVWAKALMAAWRTSFNHQDDGEHDHEIKEFSTFRLSSTSLSLGCQKIDEKVPGRYAIPRQLLGALRSAQNPYFSLAEDPKQAYALGLFTFQLPTTEMNVVTNADIITTPYRIGAQSPPMAVVGHTGDLGGFLSAYWTFPQEDSAVVVLCSSFQVNGDPTNIVAQLVTQTLFDLQPAVDFLTVSREIVTNAKARWDILVQEWNSHRDQGTISNPKEAYQGIYTNVGLAMTLEVSGFENLRLRINGNEDQIFDLYHYHHDTWTFLPASRDECIRQGFSAYLYSWQAFLIEFTDIKGGHFQSVRWNLDMDSRVEKQSFSFQPT